MENAMAVLAIVWYKVTLKQNVHQTGLHCRKGTEAMVQVNALLNSTALFLFYTE